MAKGTFIGAIKVKKLVMGSDPGLPGGPSVVTGVLKCRGGGGEEGLRGRRDCGGGQIHAVLLALMVEKECGWPLKAVGKGKERTVP